MKVLIESDILDANGHEVIVALDDDGNVGVYLLDRDGPHGPQTIGLLTLDPSEANTLGNKLRLAAKKAH